MNVFSEEVAGELISRIEKLQPGDHPEWGKMSADQVLAHCNVTYAMAFQPEKYPRPGGLKKILLRLIAKNYVTGPKPYRKNVGTAPEFIQKGQYDFEKEKAELISNIRKTAGLGRSYFEGRESVSFGKLSADEWNMMFYKHLDHHLKQFGK